LLGDRRKARLAPTSQNAAVQFTQLQKRVNYLAEMMKFVPDFERAGYAGLSEDDEAVMGDWDAYGTLAATAEEESLPGRYGNVKRDLNADGTPAGYGIARSYEELDLMPTAGEFNHIDATKGGFNSSQLFDSETSSLANMSSATWEETKAFLKTQTKSYYEIAMEHGGDLSDLSNKEAYLLMTGMLESRTRVWLTMEELFGKFDEKNDEKRIAIIDGWVAAAEQELNPENISLLSVFLESQESFTNRLSGFYGGTMDGYLSSEDKTRTSAFFNALQEKVTAYAGELEAMGETDKKTEVTDMWDMWVAPAQDESAYPNYGGYDWATTPGNILADDDGGESRQVVDQTKGLLASEYKGLRAVKVKTKRPDGTVFEANPYDHVWGTHIRGVFQNLIDTYVNQNLSVSVGNRRKSDQYQAKQEEYDNKVWDQIMWDNFQARTQAQKKAEQNKQAGKQKESIKKLDQQQRASVNQALAKKRSERKSQERNAMERAKVTSKTSSKQNSNRLAQGFKAAKMQSSKSSSQALERNKSAFKKIFGKAQTKLQTSATQQAKKFSVAQSQKATKNRSVQATKSNQLLAKIAKQNKRR
jgi:hypothetical protein